MHNKELIKTLSSRLGKSPDTIQQVLTRSFQILSNTIDKDFSITIPDLGTFNTYIKPKRKSYNPFHKKHVILPHKRIIKFTPSSSIKKDLKKIKHS